MLAMALVAAKYFRKLNSLSGWLMLPYLLWLCLATALNYETGKLNPGADAAPLGITGVK
jgi:benzodiazapine receptor